MHVRVFSGFLGVNGGGCAAIFEFLPPNAVILRSLPPLWRGYKTSMFKYSNYRMCTGPPHTLNRESARSLRHFKEETQNKSGLNSRNEVQCPGSGSVLSVTVYEYF